MVQNYEWLPFFGNIKNVDTIENELAIFTFSEIREQLRQAHPDLPEMMRCPHKFNFFLIVNHIAGPCRFKVDMEEYEVTQGGNILHCAPGQIVAIEEISADFDAHVLILSEKFIESLLVYLNGSIPYSFDFRRRIVVPCPESEMRMQDVFVKTLRYVLSDKENPFRLQVTQHIMMAIFYASDKPHMLQNGSSADVARTNADVLTKQFLELVKSNFKRERQLQFYADKMCITTRYLSRIVKECTGASASDWIERYVVLEARALLKSSNMTIQQVSNELSFPSQTFFGKYFKRRVGMSPKEYRRLG
jgi:AraC-like DNA-binding protein